MDIRFEILKLHGVWALTHSGPDLLPFDSREAALVAALHAARQHHESDGGHATVHLWDSKSETTVFDTGETRRPEAPGALRGLSLKIAIVGAAGRTGSELVKQALNRGHVVRALAHHRLPNITQEGVTWLTGSVEDLSTLKRLIDDCDLAISAIGPRPGHEDVCSTATKELLEAGVRRLIVVSGMAVTLPGDRKGLLDRISSMMVAAMAPKVFKDKVRELELLRASATDWTAVRVGMLTDRGTIRPAKADLHRPPGIGINTASLAAFCLDEAENARFPRSAPFAST